MVFQQILNGLTNGSIYALLAIGVTMIYKSLGNGIWYCKNAELCTW